MITILNRDTEDSLGFDEEALIEKVVDKAAELEHFPVAFEVNVTLTDNEGIHKVNKQYRDIDRPTDVLSFPMLTYHSAGDFSQVITDKVSAPQDFVDPETGMLILGDIVISLDKVREQAAEYGHSEKRELAFLTAHSMLHLFGYDHMEDAERETMEMHQEDVLRKLGITRDMENVPESGQKVQKDI